MAGLSRSPQQLNTLQTSDAELVKLSDQTTLAITIDGLIEEIAQGLYEDPYVIGWMTIISSMSDLNAVGAKPMGVLLLENIPKDYPEENLISVHQGIKDAVEYSNTFVFGGDTNQSESLHTASVAVGLIEDNKVISRIGVHADDLILMSGKMGMGMMYAYERLIKANSQIKFYPKPDLRQGQLIRQFGSACIDTSDGFFPALCNLMELNGVGFHLEHSLSQLVQHEIASFCEKNSIPPSLFLAGPHGEFELLFTMPKNKYTKFLSEANGIGWYPEVIGQATKRKGLVAKFGESKFVIDPFEISNLYELSNGCANDYLQDLIKIDKLWQSQIRN